MTVQQSSPPQQGHGIGGLLVLGLLVASHRLRRGLGWIAVGLVVLGGLLLLLSAADPDLGGVGGVLMLIGALGLGSAGDLTHGKNLRAMRRIPRRLDPRHVAHEFRMHNDCAPQVHERLPRWHAAD
jgi:hypothetical protein